MSGNEQRTKPETPQPAASGLKGFDSPGVIVFPPVLYIGTLLLGLTVHWALPVHLASGLWIRVAGAILFIAGGGCAGWASRTMKKAGTNVLPSKPSLAIVTGGPYGFSRNPIYVANAIAYLGLALAFNSAWPLLLFVPMVLILHWDIVLREERYLETKFGDLYLAYKVRVRRWL